MLFGGTLKSPSENSETSEASETSKPLEELAGEINNAAKVSDQILPSIQQVVSNSIHVESDADGKTRLSFTIPERPILEGFLQTAARLLNSLTTPPKE
jgi:hypothetical protein